MASFIDPHTRIHARAADLGIHGHIAAACRKYRAGGNNSGVSASGKSQVQAVAHILQWGKRVHVVRRRSKPAVLENTIGVRAHATRCQNHGLAADAQRRAFRLGHNANHATAFNNQLFRGGLGEDIDVKLLNGVKQHLLAMRAQTLGQMERPNLIGIIFRGDVAGLIHDAQVAIDVDGLG